MSEITNGISQTFASDDRIIIYTVSKLGVTSLKSWSDAVVASLEHWPADNYLVIYDLSTEGVAVPFLALTGYNIYNLGITTAGQKRVDTILEARPKLKVKLALVLSLSLSGDMVARRGRQPDNISPQVEYKVYFDQPGAIDWLAEFIVP
jgi:hypothetical protein